MSAELGVTGVGVWAPGYRDLAQFREGAADPSITDPACGLADPRAKRGTSRLARMLGEVVHQAATDADVELSTVPTVYASAWGEIDIMIALLQQIFDGDVGLSPLRFKHSVHNSASGLVSIATSNRGFSTAVAAGQRTVEQGVIESLALLASGAEERVILAIAEDRLPKPLERYSDHEALAVGFCFEREPRGEPKHGWVGMPRRASGSVVPPELPVTWAANPTARALPILEALAGDAPASVPLSATARPFVLDVRPARRRG